MDPEDAFPSLSGRCLIAMPGMADARFERAVIYLCAHSKEGAMGFVINRTMETPSIPDFLLQLEIITEEEHANLPGSLELMDMHVGGPVEPGRGFVLHTGEFESDSTVEVQDGICLTATLEILREISKGKGPKDFILALGYSGWAGGQLEDEIRSNSWLTVDCNSSLLFDTAETEKYSRSLALLGIDETLLSSEAGNA